MWHPTEEATDDDRRQKELKYNHRISIKKIGQLLAGWEFLPDFASKDFQLEPTLMGSIVDGTKMSMPSHGPVVFLAHGYLGSRFDLSHLAESLAQEGTSKKLDVMLAPLPALTSHSL
jgi:predicted dienelactone hydrolase